MDIKELYRSYLKSSGVSTDSRTDLRNKIFFALKGESFDGNRFVLDALDSGAILAVSDDPKFAGKKGVFSVGDSLKCLQALASHHRKELGLPIIAITGSNGKTTTKELVAAVLARAYKVVFTQGNFNNHIGVPLTLLRMDDSTEIGVVEMGANHQKEIEALCKIAEPDYGYITNFGKAHLEGFGGFEGVIKGKSELYDFLKIHGGKIFVNKEDEIQVRQSEGGKCFYFGEGAEVDCEIRFKNAEPYAEVVYKDEVISSRLMGPYNAKNMMAAIAMAAYFKVEKLAIKEGIEGYVPENNRSQVIDRNGNRILLDAYNANPTSMLLAIQNIEAFREKNSKVAILGDMFEVGKTTLEEHQKIVDYLEASGIDQVFVCGPTFAKTETKKVRKFKDFEQLRKEVEKAEFPNSVILIKGSRGMAMERILTVLP